RAGVEQCDDANTSNADACLNSCTSATCGDGFVRAGVEQCDDGNTSNTDTCTNVCNNAVCGDGFVRAGVEACDDGNTSNTDACLNSCAAATCGDGFVRAGVEQCDDANSITTDACISCVNAFCGDGFTRSGVEECDTGPTLNPPATPGTYRCESCTGDADGDGYLPSENDCAPTNFAINPGASDTVYFDAVDSNCDNFSGDASDGNIRVVQAATCAGGPFPTARCFSSANYSNPLQSAINASSAGQIVLVRGTVAITPTQLKDGVDVYGGWLSAWTAWSSSTANYSTVSYTTTSGNQIQAALWGYGLNSASVTDVNYLRINTVRGTTDTTDNVATSFYGVNVGDSTNFRLVNNIVTVGDAYAGAAANNGLWARESTSPVGGTGDSPWVDPGPRWSTVYAMGGQGNGWYAYCPILNGGSGVHPFQVIRGFSGQNGGHAGGSSIGVLLSNASASQVQNNTITAGSGGAGGDGIGGGGPSAGGQGGHSVSVWIIGSTAPSGWPAISGALGTPEDCPTATAGTYGGNTLSYGSAGNGGYAAENDWDEGRPGFQARCHRQTSVFEWSYDCNPQATTNLLGTSLEGWANGGGYNFPGPQACSPAMSPVPAY
ncbi:MAG: DUF4215 domain-containing protein, partial [Myxococcales bacterium]|nr:DUF4215 domain-containing protein [Myxococcales bacterium]